MLKKMPGFFSVETTTGAHVLSLRGKLFAGNKLEVSIFCHLWDCCHAIGLASYALHLHYSEERDIPQQISFSSSMVSMFWVTYKLVVLSAKIYDT